LAIFSNILINPKGGIEREMKTLRKIRKNAKALSPVVASIILIAVTVAVSIAVAAWMGALTVGFMSTEEIKITSMTCTVGDASTGTIALKVSNTGTNAATISEVWVNNVDQTSNGVFSGDATATINGNAQKTVTITLLVEAGNSYSVKLISAQGNTFTYTGTAPN
jgi:flagellin-like protein